MVLNEATVLDARRRSIFLPTAAGLEVRFRIDGVLQLAGISFMSIVPNVIARLKVLADMITYRTDIPQEGRICGHERGRSRCRRHVPHPLWGWPLFRDVRQDRTNTSGWRPWAARRDPQAG